MWKETVDYLTINILGPSGRINDTINFFIRYYQNLVFAYHYHFCSIILKDSFQYRICSSPFAGKR